MFKRTTVLAAIILILPIPAMAQDPQSSLPTACQTAQEGMAIAQSMPMGHSMDMDEAHAALMAGMETMNSDMMEGSQASDLDVAFVCSMIPHHQGAISMARAELEYGKDDWARAMAQKVVDAQMQEIADMTKWLEDHGK